MRNQRKINNREKTPKKKVPNHSCYPKITTDSMNKPSKITIDSLEFPYLQIRSVSDIKVTPVYIDISEEGYSQPPWEPSRKAHVKNEYEDLNLSIIVNPSQYVALVKEIQNPQPGPKTIKLEYKDKTIVFKGVLKELNNIEDYYDSEEYTDVSVKFGIHLMEIL